MKHSELHCILPESGIQSASNLVKTGKSNMTSSFAVTMSLLDLFVFAIFLSLSSISGSNYCFKVMCYTMKITFQIKGILSFQSNSDLTAPATSDPDLKNHLYTPPITIAKH